jgi:phage shock protein A
MRQSIGSLKAQEAPLTTHINQLTAARAKLASAQSLEQARGTMDRILTSTTSIGIPSSSGDDQELRSIRRLIAESEALAELKG